MTMTLVETTTVGSGGAATIVFSSIPQTATDLVIKISARSTHANYADPMMVLLNSGGSYLSVYVESDGSSWSTSTNSSGRLVYINGSTTTSNTFNSSEIYLPNYTSSSAKTTSADGGGENNSTANPITLWGYSWSGSSAVTSITLDLVNGDFAQYTTASLYTITKGSGGATVS